MEWTFRTLFGLLIALIMWQGQRIIATLDKHDEQIGAIKVEFAKQQSKTDTQMSNIRETLLDIKAGVIEMDRKLDRHHKPRE